MNKFIGVLLILVLAASCKKEMEPIVKITTEYGDIKIRLYDKTPKHRDNFLKLVDEKFYDGLLFHRVINHFMIQGGDPTSKNAGPDVMLGEGDVDYRIEAEFVPEYFHKKGVLAAAREGDDTNPERKSSGAQFYIVQGNVYSPEQLEATVITNDFNLNKVASVQGVRVFNINELANAVKPTLLPGEEMTVTVVKEGKEFGQGVAFLDDGTMIVVENAKDRINETMEVVVTSALQTAAGRMIFARIKEQ